jgi:hypothetical protein
MEDKSRWRPAMLCMFAGGGGGDSGIKLGPWRPDAYLYVLERISCPEVGHHQPPTPRRCVGGGSNKG